MLLSPDVNLDGEEEVLLEPRIISKTFVNHLWPTPHFASVVDGKVQLVNNTENIIPLFKNDHICQIFKTKVVEQSSASHPTPHKKHVVSAERPFSKHVVVDPQSQLTQEEKKLFVELNLKYDEVFEPIIGRYNDYDGKLRARVNLGKTSPPTRKLHVPQYDKNNLDLLQEKFDELEANGVFARPEDVNVIVEHVSPSFLVKKPSGGYRLVTAFNSLGQYCKTLPVTMSTVDTVLRQMGTWNCIITTDLRDAFYQIPLEHSSMKWCGTMTPFRGLRVYQVAAQGMPGSSEALEEMLCTVLGEYVQQGWIAKIADDLTVGGATVAELLEHWTLVMHALHRNGLKLKAIKTIILPLFTQLLGWDWHRGTISASKHKISALVSCEPPKTISAMRSFIGAFKTFNRVVKQCTNYLTALEELIAGKLKNEGITWTESALAAFKSAQKALENTPSICLPRPSDELVIVHDGSNEGIGSILFVKRNGSIHLGQFYSAKLKSHHQKWLPCEIEALSITTSIQHFSPIIRESRNITQILTDSRPCVQSWQKLLRGEFSSSARVATFLSTLSDYKVELQHLKGSMNLPSDFQSRNPPVCTSRSCQICKFVEEIGDSVVRKITVESILTGRAEVPYSNRAAWRDVQMGCSDLKRVHAHLTSGTRPTQKARATTVKRYLQKAAIGKDGLLIVIQSEPFLPRKELIIVPQQVVLGLMTSLHLRLNHPTENQLAQIFQRSFFALKMQHFAKITLENCDVCQSLRALPKELHSQESTDIPLTPCRSFASDIVRRYRQKIYVIRDTFSSFTCAELIPSEDAIVLREQLCKSISSLRPSPQTLVEVRVDNASGFVALREDHTLKSLKIHLDFGRRHNKNKNAVADKAIQELIAELLRINPEGGQVNPLELAQAVNQLNSRIRGRGLTSWEIFTQRDTETGKGLDVQDSVLTELQINTRCTNQASSSKHKASGGKLAEAADVSVGSLVYIKDDSSKLKARDRYIVVKLEGNRCHVKKLLKSSLRDRSYDMKLTEVFPVSTNVIHNESYLKGLEKSELEEEEDDVRCDNLEVEAGDSQSSLTADQSSPFQYENNDPACGSFEEDHHNSPAADEEVNLPLPGDIPSPAVEQRCAPAAVEQRCAPAGGSEEVSTTSTGSRRSGRACRKPAWMSDYVEK